MYMHLFLHNFEQFELEKVQLKSIKSFSYNFDFSARRKFDDKKLERQIE